jgi:hypothetical protein
MIARDNWNPWWVTLAILGLACAVLAFGRGQPGAMRESMSFSITVIPADAVNLDCSSDARFGSIHCGFDAQGKPQPGPNPLRPYVTVNRELLLLSGVFEDPRVASWLQQARRTGSDARVTLKCTGSLLGQFERIPVRWQFGAAFGPEHDVPVAKINACEVVP